jgi:hypothetical protein
MAQQQIIEGTSEQIATLLREGRFDGCWLRVTVDPGESDEIEASGELPNSFHNAAQLETLYSEE